jgi:hypothetical protein
MKPVRTILSVLVVLVASAQFTSAQIRKIPAGVTESFKTRYSSATNVEWKDRLTSFTATFEHDGKKHEAYFDDDGSWKQTQTVIEESELPAAVNDGFQKSKYTDWTIDRVERIDRNDNTTDYRVQIKKGDIRKKNLLFGSDGRMKKDKITV